MSICDAYLSIQIYLIKGEKKTSYCVNFKQTKENFLDLLKRSLNYSKTESLVILRQTFRTWFSLKQRK